MPNLDAAEIAAEIVRDWLTHNYDEAQSLQECISDGRVNEDAVRVMIAEGVVRGHPRRAVRRNIRRC